METKTNLQTVPTMSSTDVVDEVGTLAVERWHLHSGHRGEIMKPGFCLLSSVMLVLFLMIGCTTTPVTFTDGTPRHESINIALQANGLDMRLVSIIDEGTTGTYRGMILTSYALSETEVTQGDYETVLGPTGAPYSVGSGDAYPEYYMSWYEAAEFCNALSARCGLEGVYDESTWEADFTRNGFYLPLEAQWEFAAGGPNHYQWSLGETFNESDYVIWDSQPRPVKSHPANGFGLHDMTGNVYEWCHDWYGEAYPDTGASDPSGPANGSLRIVRGGTWVDLTDESNETVYLECDWRGAASSPSLITIYIGFRVAAGGHGNWQ